VSRHADLIAPGDRVFLYLCGPRKANPGLYAVARVLTHPAELDIPEWQSRHGVASPKKDKPVLRVRLKVERVFAVPVAREALYALPELARNQLVTAHMGSNFPLSEKEAAAVARLVAAPPEAPRLREATPKPKKAEAGPLKNIHEVHLEELLAEDLDVVEPGLQLVRRQQDAGAAGRIDLLCRSAEGELVVVEVKRLNTRAEDVYKQTMAYVGWVRRNLAENGQAVRGIIVGGRLDEKVLLAIEGTPNLKYRRLSLTVEAEGEA
jgi:hypothetical protein